jgi:hypothetical protein
MASKAQDTVALADEDGGDFRAPVQDLKNLDTPRTREACRKLGLTLEDLQIRPEKDFYIPGDAKALQRVRFEHFEKRRKERLAMVLAERAKVIAENAKKGEVPGVQSAQFLSMLESLFEKESKRLESDLKGRLRQHSSLVKENEEQLRKEQTLNEKMDMDHQKRMSAAQQSANKSKMTGQKVSDRMSKNNEIIAKLDHEHAEQQEKYKKEMLAEEERMARYGDSVSVTNRDKAKERNSKHLVIKEAIKETKARDGERIDILDQQLQADQQEKLEKREELHRFNSVKSEERHLHIMDVRQQKASIDRVENYRRDELKAEADSKVERIETLLAVKDQLLDQRKGRNMKTEATKGARGLNLRRDCLPGPGQYEAPKSTLQEATGAALDRAQPPGLVDIAEKAAKKAPPPGAYNYDVLANGDRVGRSVNAAVSFGNRDRESFLDDAIRAKESIPAPGKYERKSELDHRGMKMRRERIVDNGLDKFSTKRVPTWARPGTETPGPAMYSVDDYMRKEVLRRAQRSLPNLTRDMLRPGDAGKAGSSH